MMTNKCKVFSYVCNESDQEEINEWLKSNDNIEIKFITQSESEETFPTVIIWYEPKNKE